MIESFDLSTLPDDAIPWERLPGETHKNYAYFRTYVNLGGERTHRGVMRQFDLKSSGYITELAKKWVWDERIRLRQQSILNEYQAGRMEALIDMNRNQAKLGESLSKLAAIPMSMIKELLGRGTWVRNQIRSLETMTVKELTELLDDISKIIDKAAKIQRIANDMPTEIVKNDMPNQLGQPIGILISNDIRANEYQTAILERINANQSLEFSADVSTLGQRSVGITGGQLQSGETSDISRQLPKNGNGKKDASVND